MTVMHPTTLETLAAQAYRSASWWASAARALDELDERLCQDACVDSGPAGAFADAISRQPALSNDVARLVDDRDRLYRRMRLLRQLVSEVAGDEHQVSAVANELAELAAGEERYLRRSGDIIWESFLRDIGGER